MHPVLLKLGPLPIHSYGFLIAIGFLIALHFIQKESKRAGIDPEVIGNAAFWSLILGITGTRLLHIIMYPEFYAWNDPVGWIAIWRGGLVFQGALPPVIVFLVVYLRKHGIRFTQVADISLPYIVLAHAIGRLGCFMYGCCYGKTTESFASVCFPRVPFDASKPITGSPAFLDHLNQGLIPLDAQWSLPVHPTQLYSSAGLVLLCVLLLMIRKHYKPFDGILLPSYFALYGLFRFGIEFLRGDHNPVHVGELTDQQIMCLTFIGIGVVLFVVMKRYMPPAAVVEPRAG